MSLLLEMATLSKGQSYWKAQLNTGRIVSELDPAEWLEDIIGSGDIAHVTLAMLCTPQGEIHLEVKEPYSAFHLSQGMLSFTGRQKTAQIVGVMNDAATRHCNYAVWDVAMQRVFVGSTTVHHFESWRPGIPDLRRLNLEALDLRGAL